MKKLYSALLVVALTVAMVLPVFAAPSPQAEAKASVSNATVAVTGAEVKALAADVFKEVNNVLSNTTHLASFGINTSAKVAACFDLKVEIPEGQESVSVPVKVNNAKVGDYVYIVHRKAVNGEYEVVGQGVLGADMTINATFTSFSPVIVMVVDAAQVSAAGVKAPKTGEF
mgnify:CR=1 FL=1